MSIELDRFPGGKTKALTLSYDDGRTEDRRMIETLNQHGIKGTFHLNSGRLGAPGYVTAEEAEALYRGHEIAAHTVTHPHIPCLPPELRVKEIMEDRSALEHLTGYPVKGMSYPYGSFSDDSSELLRHLGIHYCRTVKSTGSFEMPGDFRQWHPTCHHRDDLLNRTRQFLAMPHKRKPLLFYVWGHSYEFATNDNWELLEQFCGMIGNNETIWYATNKQLFDYKRALELLELSADGGIIHNPSAMPVWLSWRGEPVEIEPGAVWRAEAGILPAVTVDNAAAKHNDSVKQQNEPPAEAWRLDSNMFIGTADDSEMMWHSPLDAPFRLAGFPWIHEERVYRRLPAKPAWPIPEAVDRLADCTAGGQIHFVTNSDKLAIRVRLSGSANMYHMPATGQCGFDCYIGPPGEQQYRATVKYDAARSDYECVLFEHEGHEAKSVTLNFPLYQGVLEVLIGVSPGASVAPLRLMTATRKSSYMGRLSPREAALHGRGWRIRTS